MAKSTQPPPLSAAQLEIMNVVWDRREVTISEVWQELCRQRKVARATVQTVIGRLEEKGWLRHRNVGQAFFYSAVYSRDATQSRLVNDLVDAAFDGSVEGLVWALLKGRGVSPEESMRIQKMINEAARKKAQRKKAQRSKKR